MKQKQPTTIIFDKHFKYVIKKDKVSNFEDFVLYMVLKTFKGHEVLDVDSESDFMRRIFVSTKDETYVIRTWDIYETQKSIVVDFSIFKEEEN
jgi:hypothetical protein